MGVAFDMIRNARVREYIRANNQICAIILVLTTADTIMLVVIVMFIMIL